MNCCVATLDFSRNCHDNCWPPRYLQDVQDTRYALLQFFAMQPTELSDNNMLVGESMIGMGCKLWSHFVAPLSHELGLVDEFKDSLMVLVFLLRSIVKESTYANVSILILIALSSSLEGLA